MGLWDSYKDRIDAHGGSKHEASRIRELRGITNRLPDNLSYTSIELYPQDYGYNIEDEESASHMVNQNVAIINSDNLDEKTIISMPTEDIRLGSLIHWMDNYWLVVERDANTTVYTRAKLKQCNHLLKWITHKKQIIEQWCVVSDGTKYMSGEQEDRNFVITRPDTRLQLQIARNKYTLAFNRESRFLIDDDDSPHKLAYLLTKPFKKGKTFGNEGVFTLLVQEVTGTEDDNHELGIADYYKYFPKDLPDVGDGSGSGSAGKKVWL